MNSLILNRRIVACFAISIFLLSMLVVPAAHANTACTETGFPSAHDTAAFVNPTSLPLVVEATGCDIGIYFSTPGSVNGVEVFGANKYGIVNHGADVDITGSNIHDNPYGIWFAGTGTIDGNIVTRYTNGIYIAGTATVVTVTNNVVTGLGPTESIVQNGIWISVHATAYLKGNEVSGNWYTGSGWSSGILGGHKPPIYIGATSIIAENNNIHDNQYAIYINGDTQDLVCRTTELTRNNIHHSEVAIAITCWGPADALTIENNNIHHNTDALSTILGDPYSSNFASVNHLHQNEYEPTPL